MPTFELGARSPFGGSKEKRFQDWSRVRNGLSPWLLDWQSEFDSRIRDRCRLFVTLPQAIGSLFE